jgi:hypothetical protein
VEELGRLLVLLHGARDRWQTARGVLRSSVELGLAEQARERWDEERRRRGDQLETAYLRMTAHGGGDLPERMTSTTRFWLDPPARLREETQREGRPELEHVVVRDGLRWWSYSPGWGAVSNTVADAENVSIGGGEQTGVLLDPAPWIAWLSFEVVGEAAGPDRAALRVRAHPRPIQQRDSFWFESRLPPGADEYELLVDRDRGVVLRLAGLLDGTEFSVLELVEVAFDENLPPETFVFEPPEGEELRSPLEPTADHVTIEEAARRASFAVFAPADLGDGRWQMHVAYVAPRAKPQLQEAVYISCHRTDGRHSLSLTERPSGSEPEWTSSGYELTEVVRDGRHLDLYRPPGRGEGELAVVHERDGTLLELTSGDLDEETLVDLAAGLERIEPS